MEDDKKQLIEIKTKRGEIATDFAFLENIMARIITINYFKNDNELFKSEVMEDEYFNFGLLVKIFKKIIKRENYVFPIGKLHRLQELRNIVTHSRVINTAQILKGTNKILKLGDNEFSHGGKIYPIPKIFEEYDQVSADIRAALSELPGGGTTKLELFG